MDFTIIQLNDSINKWNKTDKFEAIKISYRVNSENKFYEGDNIKD
jgi:hypothetical protein